MELISIHNEGRKPFDFMHRNQKKIILPGKSMIVPFDLCATLFGDPRIKDVNNDRARHKTYNKVRAQFGFSSGLQSEEDWINMKPNLRFEDVESGEFVNMLMDDPYGQAAVISGTPTAEANDRSAEREQIAQLTGQVAQLTQIIMQMQRDKETEGTSASNVPTSDSAPKMPGEQKQQEETKDAPTLQEVTTDSPTPTKKVAAKKVAAKK